ncbi:MAG: hypothetical protein ACFFAN_20800 [Promethearchaeota archaeon]
MNNIESEEENLKEIKYLIFQLKPESEKFEKVDIPEGVLLHELLYHDLILFFVDSEHNRVWIWEGRNSTTKMKFLSVQLAPTIRDKYGIDYNICPIDDGDEPLEFKKFIGLKK